jgi:hypothetical protein
VIPPSSVEIALALVVGHIGRPQSPGRVTRAPPRPGSVERVTDANHPSDGPGETPAATSSPPPDLAVIERDLTAVEAALAALDDGSYWVDEVTGERLPDEVLAANPVARRV